MAANLKQRIKLDQPGSQLTVAVGPHSLDLPAVAVPTAWLIQLYAALDQQHNHLPIDTLKSDLLTVFVRHCNLTEQDIKAVNQIDTYYYTLTLQDDLGRLSNEEIIATDDDHAYEEASYEYDDKCIAVQKGNKCHDAGPWHQWPDHNNN